MIQSTLKISAAFLIGITTLTSLNASDIMDSKNNSHYIVKVVEKFNNPSNTLSQFALDLECDTPILEALYYHMTDPQTYACLNNPGFVDFLKPMVIED